jgi:F420-dependent oxidoreductase-like protein
VRFSIWPSPMEPWAAVKQTVQHCEATGWDRAYMSDHFMPSFGDTSGPTNECITFMSAIAAVTERIGIGSIVLGNTYRHPAVLANQVAGIDEVSGGRAVLGLGAGWQENEHEAFGITLPPVKERLDRFEEAVQIVKGLFTQDTFTFKGAHYEITDAPMNPARPDLKLLIGGGGEKRTMRIAAQHADEWNIWSTPEEMAHKLDVLAKHCDDVGRDRSEIEVSTQSWDFLGGDFDKMKAAVEGWAAIGVDEVIYAGFGLPPAGNERNDALDRFSTEIAAQYR